MGSAKSPVHSFQLSCAHWFLEFGGKYMVSEAFAKLSLFPIRKRRLNGWT